MKIFILVLILVLVESGLGVRLSYYLHTYPRLS